MTGLLSDALRNVAMIGEISCKSLGLTRTDKDASKKADRDAGAKPGAGKVLVQRLPGCDDLARRVMDIQKQARENLQALSTAWGAGTRRLLPNANFQTWIGQQGRLEDEFKKAVQEFVDKADEVLVTAKANLGDYNIPLPTKHDIETSYAMSYTLEPIPDGSHFKGDAEVEQYLKERFEEHIAAAASESRQDALRRLAEPLSKLAERLEAYDKREREIANGAEPGRTGAFYDSAVENVQEVAKVFRSFNVLNDPEMNKISDKIEAFTKINGDMLRNRADIRTAATARAREVIASLDGLLIR